jgi:hypothetical protein
MAVHKIQKRLDDFARQCNRNQSWPLPLGLLSEEIEIVERSTYG